MDVEGFARLKSFPEFRKAFKRGDAKKLFRGQSLALIALANLDPEARYQITNFLLDRGSAITGTGVEHSNAFHVLFSRPRHDPAQTIELTKRLIAAGVDPNLPDARAMTPTAYAIQIALPQEWISRFYDVWFAQPGLDLTLPNQAGVSALDAARKIAYAPLTSRMEAYLANPYPANPPS